MSPFTASNIHSNTRTSSSSNNYNSDIKEYYEKFTPEDLQKELDIIKNEFIKLGKVSNLTNNSITSKINALKRKFKIIQEIIVSK